MLQLYIFNVHSHNDGDSTLYWFLESEGAKNSNSVASMVYDFVSKKIADVQKKYTCFRMQLEARKKNTTLVKFCAWLSKTLNVSFEHIFPIRGHSTCATETLDYTGHFMRRKKSSKQSTLIYKCFKAATQLMTLSMWFTLPRC